jgi:hypothetical protein
MSFALGALRTNARPIWPQAGDAMRAKSWWVDADRKTFARLVRTREQERQQATAAS